MTCWAFIGCTIRFICQLKIWQRECYNGYKHKHALKYSAVKAPDSIIYHLDRLLVGCCNNNHMFSQSGLLDRCQQYRPEFCLFGDPAYPVTDVLLSLYDDVSISPVQAEFNRCMSSCCEAVEWGFADVQHLSSSHHKNYSCRQLECSTEFPSCCQIFTYVSMDVKPHYISIAVYRH